MYKSDYQMTDREQTYYNKMAGFDSIMQNMLTLMSIIPKPNPKPIR